jgi:hypothetical protein
MRTIECSNMPTDWHTFSPIRFLLNETDIDLIRKNSAKLFLRIAPTILHERHNDVSPPYVFIQCNVKLISFSLLLFSFDLFRINQLLIIIHQNKLVLKHTQYHFLLI